MAGDPRNVVAMSDDDRYEDAAYVRELADGRVIVVYRRMYNTILTIGLQRSPVYDEHW